MVTLTLNDGTEVEAGTIEEAAKEAKRIERQSKKKAKRREANRCLARRHAWEALGRLADRLDEGSPRGWELARRGTKAWDCYARETFSNDGTQCDVEYETADGRATDTLCHCQMDGLLIDGAGWTMAVEMIYTAGCLQRPTWYTIGTAEGERAYVTIPQTIVDGVILVAAEKD